MNTAATPSTLQLKANSRGSWANVCSFNSAQVANIKDAALQLCLAANCAVSFKIADDHGTTLHSLDARQQPLAWQDRTT